MRKVIFSRSVLKRIAEIQSSNFSKEETMHFQIKLGYKVYYVYDQNDEAINVRAIKAPKMK
jgi:hypothetical protein